MIAVMSIGPAALTAMASAGPRTSAIQRSLVMTSGEYAPYRSTLPRPSFSEQNDRAPVASSASSNSLVDGEILEDQRTDQGAPQRSGRSAEIDRRPGMTELSGS